MRALSSAMRGVDALHILAALRLHLGANHLDLPVQPGELGFDGAQPGAGILGHLAGRLDIGAHLLRALAQKLGQHAKQRNADGQHDDREVDSLEDVGRGLHAQMEHPGNRLHHAERAGRRCSPPARTWEPLRSWRPRRRRLHSLRKPSPAGLPEPVPGPSAGGRQRPPRQPAPARKECGKFDGNNAIAA